MKAVVDYPCYHLHGRTLTVVGRVGAASWRGLAMGPMVDVEADGCTYSLPAHRVRILAQEAAE